MTAIGDHGTARMAMISGVLSMAKQHYAQLSSGRFRPIVVRRTVEIVHGLSEFFYAFAQAFSAFAAYINIVSI